MVLTSKSQMTATKFPMFVSMIQRLCLFIRAKTVYLMK